MDPDQRRRFEEAKARLREQQQKKPAPPDVTDEIDNDTLRETIERLREMANDKPELEHQIAALIGRLTVKGAHDDTWNRGSKGFDAPA